MSDRIGQLVRQRHRYGFRSGQWAMIIKTVHVRPSRSNKVRPCWLVEFPDGMQDEWPVDDPMADYQFATIEYEREEPIPILPPTIITEGQHVGRP